MNRKGKFIGLGIMSIALAGLVAAVNPQLLTAQSGANTRSVNGEAGNVEQSTVEDARNWRLAESTNCSVTPVTKSTGKKK